MKILSFLFRASLRLVARQPPRMHSPSHLVRHLGKATMILITGATGTVGSEIVKRLSSKAVGARALTRNPWKAEANPLAHVKFVQGRV